MTHEEMALSIMRNKTAYKAQRLALASRRQHEDYARYACPVMLQAWSEREELIQWLVWCDSNGIWTDDDLITEGFKPMTLQQCWDAITHLLEDC